MWNKMKNKLSIVAFCVFFTTMFSEAQMQEQPLIEEINRLFDTVPYFDIVVDYSTKYDFPNSTKKKIIKALNKELPKHFADSVFTLSDDVLKDIEKYAWKQCKNDTNCYKSIYEERCAMNIDFEKKIYSNKCISLDLILACGSWGITEAIPSLEKEWLNEYCTNFGKKEIIEMALAKLNVDSIKQVLLKKYTLSSLLSRQILYDNHMPLDTINDNNFDLTGETVELLQKGIRVAMYLENRKILLNLLDFIYVRGKYDSNIAISPIVSDVVNYFSNYYYFHSFPNYEKLRQICYDYASAIWRLDKNDLKEKEKKELEILLSTEYRTKIRNQIQDWVIENVNFEE
jgi:hypothetical protein